MNFYAKKFELRIKESNIKLSNDISRRPVNNVQHKKRAIYGILNCSFITYLTASNKHAAANPTVLCL